MENPSSAGSSNHQTPNMQYQPCCQDSSAHAPGQLGRLSHQRENMENLKRPALPIRIFPGDLPRDTLESRVRQQFRLPSEALFESFIGENIDMSMFDGKVHVPSTKQLSHAKFFNPVTGRTSNVFACDFPHCGKIFRKWHNLFDHLRIHTG